MARKVPPSAYAVPRAATTSRRSTINPFGTNRLKEWQMPEGGTTLGQAAAKLQHETAGIFRNLINQSHFGSVAELARNNSEISYERLRAILTGDMWMRFEDIALLASQLGVSPVVSFEIQSMAKKRND
jgi:hypothetical protein